MPLYGRFGPLPHRPERDGDRAIARQRDFAWKLIALARRWRARLDEKFAEAGQTQARWQALFWISAFDGKATQQQIADRIGVAASTMVRTLDALERQGLISRHASDDDKRARIVALEPAAEAVLAEISRIADELREEVLAGIHPSEAEFCSFVMDRMLSNLERS